MIKIIVLLLVVCALGHTQLLEDELCSRVNQGCGGVHQTKCCMGQQLKCKYHTPIHPEATGDCVKVCSAEGGICSGFTRDPQVCCEGLHCIMDERIPDLPGRCKNSTRV